MHNTSALGAPTRPGHLLAQLYSAGATKHMWSNGGGDTGTLGDVLQRESAIHSVELCSTHCTTEPSCTEVHRRARLAHQRSPRHHPHRPMDMRGLRVMVMVAVGGVMLASGMALVGSGLWPRRCRWGYVCPGGRWEEVKATRPGRDLSCLHLRWHLRLRLLPTCDLPILHFHSPHSRTPHCRLFPSSPPPSH